MVGRDTPSVSLWLPPPSKMEAKEMFGRKKIRKLEEEVTELKLSFGYLKDMLEEKAKQSYDEQNEKARATDKDRDSEKAVPMSQVMDEWLNGKKAGEN